MHFKYFSRLIVVTSLALLIFSGVPAPGAPPKATAAHLSPAGYDWTALTNKLQSFVPGAVNGLSFMVSRNGQTLYAQGFGNLTVNSVLPIASATKMPSGIVIMKLVEQGLIDLDRPVKDYVQGKLDWPADKNAVTMRMLFNHTSGMSVDAPCLNDQRNTTLKDCAQYIANQPLEFTPPGSRFAYSGSSIQVAGYVAEAVTGKKWNNLFAEFVAQPLGLTKFTYGVTDNPRIAGGANSDTGDYTKIMQMALAGGSYNGNRILSPATIALMETNQVAGLPKLRSPGGTTLTGYGFGWWHSDPAFLARQPEPLTTGPELSDQGAFGCTPWIDLGLNFSAILLIQDRTSTGTEIWDAVRPLIIEQIKRNTGSVATVSAASYSGTALASEAIVTAFGSNLATTTQFSSAIPLPTILAGTTVKVRDGAGTERLSPLFFVSPTQINYQIPAGTATGSATITITSGDGAVSTGSAQIFTVAPGLFSANASGQGIAAAVVLRVKANGSQSYEPVAQFDATQNKLIASPIDLGPEGEQVFLLLFGTGLRFRSSFSAVNVKVGGTDAPVTFAGAQGDFAGLDQVNARLPRMLAGRGELDVALTADGQISNTVKVSIR